MCTVTIMRTSLQGWFGTLCRWPYRPCGLRLPVNSRVYDPRRVPTRNTLSELVNAKRGISPEMAVRLSKVFGGTEPRLAHPTSAVRSCPSSPRPNQFEATKGRLGACVPKRVVFGIPKGSSFGEHERTAEVPAPLKGSYAWLETPEPPCCRW